MTEVFTVCSLLPPGPAFVQYRPDVVVDQDFSVMVYGYVWQGTTDHTPAGWVRPKYKDNRITESGAVKA